MVPGQVITRETIDFMRKLDVKEIHGYERAKGEAGQARSRRGESEALRRSCDADVIRVAGG
jgi:arginine/lysine/ornithine decarboxylase